VTEAISEADINIDSGFKATLIYRDQIATPAGAGSQ
jgi:hypothetical protein